jgi:hypothetical protein
VRAGSAFLSARRGFLLRDLPRGAQAAAGPPVWLVPKGSATVFSVVNVRFAVAVGHEQRECRPVELLRALDAAGELSRLKIVLTLTAGRPAGVLLIEWPKGRERARKSSNSRRGHLSIALEIRTQRIHENRRIQI